MSCSPSGSVVLSECAPCQYSVEDDGLQDFRAVAGLAAALEQPVLAQALRVAQLLVGERERGVRVAERAVADAVDAVGLREAVVEEQARRGDVRVEAVEDNAQVLGLVEAVVEHVAQEAPALRGAVRERDARSCGGRPRPAGWRCRRRRAAGSAGSRSSRASPRSRCRTPAGSSRGRKTGRARRSRNGVPERQQHDGAVVAEIPAAARDRLRRGVVALAHRELRLRLVQARGGKSEPRLELLRVVEEEFVPHRLLEAGRVRHFQPQDVGRGREAARVGGNPAAPGDAEALAHEEAVARALRRIQRVVRRRVVQQVDDALVAAVVDVVDERAVALHGIRRAQDVEIGRVLDLAARVARRAPQVDDGAVGRVARVELAVEAPGDAHVGPDGAEGFAAGKGRGRGDFEASDLGLRGRCQRRACQQETKKRTHCSGRPPFPARPAAARGRSAA